MSRKIDATTYGPSERRINPGDTVRVRRPMRTADTVGVVEKIDGGISGHATQYLSQIAVLTMKKGRGDDPGITVCLKQICGPALELP